MWIRENTGIEPEWMGGAVLDSVVPLVLSVPHSGERVPPEAVWLKKSPVPLLLTDIDRFVDELYLPAIQALKLSACVARVHRYAADLNRYPDDVDASSVVGAAAPAGTHPKGFHWVKTTLGEVIMTQPIAQQTHETIVRQYHDSFHEKFEEGCRSLRSRFPGKALFHLDCHSMPSQGTGAHSDAGTLRPDVVISDFNGKSASPFYMELVSAAFLAEGLGVSRNWPYQGGRITQRYGRPHEGHETIQIELNRRLYMDEHSREKSDQFTIFQETLGRVLSNIVEGIRSHI